MADPKNFCFPIPTLSNARIKLTPFVPARHASTYFKLSSPHPELYAHMTPGPYHTEEDFIQDFIEGMSNRHIEMLTFAVVDKTRPASKEDGEGELAGMISYMCTSTTHLSTEIGFVVILPPYQRTHVTTNAVGLMLQHALSRTEEGGFGLLRVVWNANSMNIASLRVAERMGFQYEGTLRWNRLVRNGRKKSKVGNGRTVPKGNNDDDIWRDTVILSHCWDDWERYGRNTAQTAMDRQTKG